MSDDSLSFRNDVDRARRYGVARVAEPGGSIHSGDGGGGEWGRGRLDGARGKGAEGSGTGGAGTGSRGGRPVAPGGRLRGVWGEAERALFLLKQSRHRAAQARRALRADAATSPGLHRISPPGTPPGRGRPWRADRRPGGIAGDFYYILAPTDGATALVTPRLDLDLRIAAAAGWSVLAAEDERLTTLVVAALAPRPSRLTWLSAGHEVALLRRADGTVLTSP